MSSPLDVVADWAAPAEAEALKPYFYDPVGFVRDCIKWPEGQGLAPHQEEGLNAIIEHKRLSIRSMHGAGKAQPHWLEIDSPDGVRKFGDLEPGDHVFGANGQPVRIRSVHERGEMDLYKVRFSDGAETYCSADHLWNVRRSGMQGAEHSEWETLSLRQIMDAGLDRPSGKNRARRWQIPTAEPLQYPYRWVPVDPYTLGAWLGDGAGAAPVITAHLHDRAVPERIRAAGYDVTEAYQSPTVNRYYVRGLGAGLRRLGVLGCTSRQKFVPREYLENLPEVRAEVLRGLLDTDGYVDVHGKCIFTSTSHQLASDVAWLVRSLGGVARLKERRNAYGPYWDVTFSLPDGRWFYIERKHSRFKPTSQKRYLHRWIDSVELIGHEPVRCISVEAEDGLYVANDGIVTHNTTFCALFILWFALTRDAMCRSGEYGIADWKIVITAGAWRQLEKFLMPEVHKWAQRLDWDRIGRKAFKTTELQRLGLRLSHGEATTLASDNVALIEGAHADAIAYLFDESKAIAAATFDAAEGAFTGEGEESVLEAFALSTSTPGEPNGRFWEIQTQKPGTEDWHPLHWTLEKVMASGRVTKTWVERRRKMWGEKTALFANRVLGEFHSADEDGVIPLSWIEAAIDRWSERKNAEDYDVESDEYPHGKYLGAADGMGVDVARQGEDKTIFALGNEKRRICELREFFHADTMETSGNVRGVLRAFPGIVPVVDTDGLGAGVTDRVREMGFEVVAFHSGEKSIAVDRSGELGFANKKAEAWWNMRELLDPAYESDVELPPDDQLLGDLTAPKWKVESNGRIRIEKKEEVKKRLGRSPDKADAVVMYFWEPTELDEAYMGSMGAEDDEEDEESWSDVA